MSRLSPLRQYAEEAAVVLGGMGLAPAYGKLLGWLLICDPPRQTSADLTRALGLSKATVSTGTRMLEQIGLVRRTPAPGGRGWAYEMTPDAFLRAAQADSYRAFRELMERGLSLVGDPDAPGAERLRLSRDFYAFIERELPNLVARFKRDHLQTEASSHGGPSRHDRGTDQDVRPQPRARGARSGGQRR